MPHIEVIARGVIVEASHVLLCQHVKKGYYYLPGGHVEVGESATAALERELMEECGQRILVCGFLGIEDHKFKQGRKERHELNLVFRAMMIGKERLKRPRAVKSKEKGIAFCWCPLDQISGVRLLPESAGGYVDLVARRTISYLDLMNNYVARHE